MPVIEITGKQIDIEMTDAHWNIIKFLREDFRSERE